jgi:hypothetical protein
MDPNTGILTVNFIGKMVLLLKGLMDPNGGI